MSSLIMVMSESHMQCLIFELPLLGTGIAFGRNHVAERKYRHGSRKRFRFLTFCPSKKKKHSTSGAGTLCRDKVFIIIFGGGGGQALCVINGLPPPPMLCLLKVFRRHCTQQKDVGKRDAWDKVSRYGKGRRAVQTI